MILSRCLRWRIKMYLFVYLSGAQHLLWVILMPSCLLCYSLAQLPVALWACLTVLLTQDLSHHQWRGAPRMNITPIWRTFPLLTQVCQDGTLFATFFSLSHDKIFVACMQLVKNLLKWLCNINKLVVNPFLYHNWTLLPCIRRNML